MLIDQLLFIRMFQSSNKILRNAYTYCQCYAYSELSG